MNVSPNQRLLQSQVITSTFPGHMTVKCCQWKSLQAFSKAGSLAISRYFGWQTHHCKLIATIHSLPTPRLPAFAVWPLTSPAFAPGTWFQSSLSLSPTRIDHDPHKLTLNRSWIVTRPPRWVNILDPGAQTVHKCASPCILHRLSTS